MLLMEPTPTPYDLRWNILGIPVRVHPMFWLVSVVMGWNTLDMGFQFLFIWIACIFASILIHELGHIGMGLAFGSRGHIVLYGFGGLAIGSNRLHQRWQRVSVSFAGPLAGFTALGLLLLALWAGDPDSFPIYLRFVQANLGLPMGDLWDMPGLRRIPSPMMLFTVNTLIFINLLWGLVNLLPIWPLDGGQICREVCEGVSPDAGLSRSLGISLVAAGLLAIHCILVVFGTQILPLPFGSYYSAFFFGILAVQSFQMLQQVNAQRHWPDEYRDE